jgi:hypothetical protein
LTDLDVIWGMSDKRMIAMDLKAVWEMSAEVLQTEGKRP